MAKNSRKKLLAVLFSAVVFNLVFFSFMPKVPGLPCPPEFGTLGFSLLTISASVVLFIGFSNYLTRNLLLLLGLSSVLSILALFRGSLVDRTFLGLTSIGILLAATLAILVRDIPKGLIDFANQTLFLAIRWAKDFGKSQASLKDQLGAFKQGASFWRRIHGNTLSKILRGVGITLPVAAIVLILLSSADPIFSASVKSVLAINWQTLPYWIVGRSIFSSIFIILVVSILYLKPEKQKKSEFTNISFPLEATILTLTIAGILLGFLIIQYKYIFSSVQEIDLIQFGVKTYSEYVRRGFAELVIVAGIIYLVSTFALQALKATKGIILKLSTSMLLVELLVFIGSIFRRVYLYQLEHGFTRIRLYGSGFLIILALLTAVLVLKLFLKSRRWFFVESAIIIAGVIIISSSNVDTLVSKYFQPTVNNEVDYIYIARLSSDGVDGWIEAYNNSLATGSRLLLLSRNLNKEEERQLMYSYWTSYYVQRNYSWLVRIYGTDEEYLALNPLVQGQVMPDSLTRRDIRKFNIVDYVAYQKLKEHIKPEEITQTTKMLEGRFMAIDPKLRFQSFDRDLYSPLVW